MVVSGQKHHTQMCVLACVLGAGLIEVTPTQMERYRGTQVTGGYPGRLGRGVDMLGEFKDECKALR